MTPLEATLLSLLGTIVIAALQILGIWRTRELERVIHRLNIGLDQRVQRLCRIRHLVTQLNFSHVYLLKCRAAGLEIVDHHFVQQAEMSANQAELRGLAFAIDDKELRRIVCEGYRFIGLPPEERCLLTDEMDIRNRSRRLHLRIYQLLEEVTRQK